MNIYIIIGIVILAIILIYFVFYRKKNAREPMSNKENGGPARQPTEAEIEEMQKKLQEILPYDLKDEEKISKQLPNMSIQQMAQYADKITLQHLNDDKFLNTMIPEDIIQKMEKAPFDDEEARPMLLNVALFGNLSKIAISAKEPYASRAKSAVEFLKSKL